MTIAWRAVGILLVTAGTVGLVPRTGQAHGSITTTVLFDREIVSLLERRCVSCHSEGGLSFPLSTYEQTWVKRLSMRTEVLRRHMPPWAAVPGYGEFANDNGLTLREQQFLVSWVEGLGPRNAGSTFLNVPGRRPGASPGARLGPRRRVAAGRARYCAGGAVHRRSIQLRPVVHHATIDLGLTEPRRIGAIEFLPGDRRRLRAARFRRGIHGAVAGQLDAVVRVREAAARAWPSSSPRARACRRNSITAPGRIRSPTSAAWGCFWLGERRPRRAISW